MNKFIPLANILFFITLTSYSQHLTIDSIQFKQLLKEPDIDLNVKNFWNKPFIISTNKETFALLKSITKPIDKFFPLNFHTLNIIVFSRSEVLSEALGTYCIDMVMNYPKETFQYFVIDSLTLDRYAFLSGYELYFADEDQSDTLITFKEFKAHLSEKLDLSDPHTKKAYERFLLTIMTVMKRMN